MHSFLMPFLASTILASSPATTQFSPLITQAAPSLSRIQEMHGKNLIELFLEKGLVFNLVDSGYKEYVEKKKKKTAILQKAARKVTNSPRHYPNLNYEEIYISAGEKFGIPWQILYGLHMTESGGRNGIIYNSAGTGAQGPMQFMPGTWKAYGIDADNDGYADINNAYDAIYSAANYLSHYSTLEQGLRAYGGNFHGTLAYAQKRGYEL